MVDVKFDIIELVTIDTSTLSRKYGKPPELIREERLKLSPTGRSILNNRIYQKKLRSEIYAVRAANKRKHESILKKFRWKMWC